MEQDHIDNVCKIGQGAACCRYLAVGVSGFECLKHTNQKAYLDQRVARMTMHARGDNCSGSPGQEK